MKLVTIDFETEGIEPRPKYPPIPVSVSIKEPGKPVEFLAWGHHRGTNTHTFAQAAKRLREVWDAYDGLLFHNAKFDLDVAEVHFGLKFPPWERIHDTMFLLYLDNPHSRQIGLKPAAERLLGMPAEERDVVADWLVENQPVEGVKIGKGVNSKEPAGKYIAWAPPEIVGPYADGDVIRTEGLFYHLYDKIVETGMLASYERERKLLPILLGMERRGVAVDLPRLSHDVAVYTDIIDRCDAWLRKRLGASDDLNIDSGDQLIKAMIAAGEADPAEMGVTKTGKIQTNKAALTAGVKDPQLLAVMKYLTQLKTCVRTFMEPWLRMALRAGGRIYTTWHQTRGGAKGGTRTGRLSSTPNFQNMPKEFEPLFWSTEHPDLPKPPFTLPDLPLCRSYIVAIHKGHVLIGRDYSQQEPRILAHFEDGALKDQYIENPWIDYHDNAKEHLEEIFGRPFARKPVKNINLGIIYGQGDGSLAEKNGESVEDTKRLRKAIFGMYPGLEDMYKDMRFRARTNQPIRTWGGRIYYCEPPIISKGRVITFEYKMVNVLIQGSAADCTKEALIRFAQRIHNRPWYILLQVHDEIVISAPAEDVAEAMEVLRECMESVEFDVQILSEGAWSEENWASMRDYDKKGKPLLTRVDVKRIKGRSVINGVA